MIQANELRLGNIIGMSHWDHPGQTVEKVVDCTVLNLIAGYVPTPEDMKAIEFVPIKLTEEILLKCGFDIKSVPYHCINGNVVLYHSKGDFLYKYTGIEIKHLHQLQNLYFALTGEELEVNI